jgi:hypothetical protein
MNSTKEKVIRCMTLYTFGAERCCICGHKEESKKLKLAKGRLQNGSEAYVSVHRKCFNLAYKSQQQEALHQAQIK